VEAAIEECLRDRNYYEITGGGVTLSGGEPLLQENFASSLLSRLEEEGLHTAVETAGYLPWETFEKTRRTTDLYLFDIKHLDPQSHLKGTGKDNRLILDNLHRLSECGAAIVLRYVLLPGYNMDDDALLRLAALTRELDLERLELLPFHRLGRGKYGKLGREPQWRESEPPSQLQLETIRARLAEQLGCTVALG
jgi:pyruvate formate lyase activating enzyme